MVRGWLDEETLKAIADTLPDIGDPHAILALNPQLISMQYPHASLVPVAAPCFHDTWHALWAAAYALHEALAERIWYSEKRVPPGPMEATFFSRFFADDCALRLYAAGEHLAAAIVYMLEIQEPLLKTSARRVTSRQARVARFLKKSYPATPVGQVVVTLGKSKDWTAAMKHRNDWVHSQPPPVAGLGVVFRRERRWQTASDGTTWTMPLGAGDPPAITLDSLLATLQGAIRDFAHVLHVVRDEYLADLAIHGIVLNDAGSGLICKFY
jgi:hypothetical protein